MKLGIRDIALFGGMTSPLPRLEKYIVNEPHAVGSGMHIVLVVLGLDGVRRFSIVRFLLNGFAGSYGSEKGLWEIMTPDGDVTGYCDMSVVSEIIEKHT